MTTIPAKAGRVVIIEYKHYKAKVPDLAHPSYRALADLADNYTGGALPFMVVFYWPKEWWFRVLPVNKAARQHYHHVEGLLLSEQRFVRSLYALRNKALAAEDEAVMASLNNSLPNGG